MKQKRPYFVNVLMVLIIFLCLCLFVFYNSILNINIRTLPKNTNAINNTKEISQINFSEDNFVKVNSQNKDFKNILENEGISLKLYDIPLGLNQIIWDHTIHDNIIYYVVTEKSMSDYYTEISIYRYDLINGRNNVIYTFNDKENPSYITELKANDNFLFWTKVDSNFNWEIYKMDLKSNNVNIIRTSSELKKSLIEPILSVSNNFITWYESDKINENLIEERIMIYDIQKDEVQVLDKDVNLDGNPYKRPYIFDDKLTYLSKDGDKYIIKIYDLIKKVKQKLIIPRKVTRVMSNGNITIWNDAYYKSNVFLFDHKTAKIKRLEKGKDILQMGLINNNVIILYSNDEDNFSNIYYYDFNKKMKINLTNNNSENVSYTLLRISLKNECLFEITDGKQKKFGVIKFNI